MHNIGHFQYGKIAPTPVLNVMIKHATCKWGFLTDVPLGGFLLLFPPAWPMVHHTSHVTD